MKLCVDWFCSLGIQALCKESQGDLVSFDLYFNVSYASISVFVLKIITESNPRVKRSSIAESDPKQGDGKPLLITIIPNRGETC